MKEPLYFNAHHAPIGAFASFTLGSKGPRGGLGLELAGPADESLFIGVEDAETPGRYRALPFFQEADDALDEQQNFDPEAFSGFNRAPALSSFSDDDITRRFRASTDTWSAGDLTFTIVSPVVSVPDPSVASDAELREALAPAVLAELTIDNRNGSRERKAFFGYAGSDRASKMRTWKDGGLTLVGQGTTTAIATDAADAYGGTAWQPEAILQPSFVENLPFMLGSIGLLVVSVPAGELRRIRFAVCFFREGTATVGIRTRYLYRRWFASIEEVARFTLGRAYELTEQARTADGAFEGDLSDARRFLLAQAIHSYFGCTQALETEGGEPLWVVHEGEYRMMNTFDLAVDQAFFELALNPWTVRNVLDQFVSRYSYFDEVVLPGDPTRYAGGIAFTHDMGVANAFSESGRSGYEQAGLRGCFSYMSCEELVNWVLTACLYVSHTGDRDWLNGLRSKFVAVAKSLMQRDHPDASLRNGVMGLDSSRCEGGKEITTYDSLDASLGQARNNVYLAVKCWASYVLLAPLLESLGEMSLAAACLNSASLCWATVARSADYEGMLPAVLFENVPARIIPAIEGLVYPLLCGRPEVYESFPELVTCLKRHLEAVISSGMCRFSDGGWRLSSTSRNSWLSKIFLCQFVAERLLQFEPDSVADLAHTNWLLDAENGYYAFSDQMMEGKAVGSRYYPRGVTAVLWLTGSQRDPLQELSARCSGGTVASLRKLVPDW